MTHRELIEQAQVQILQVRDELLKLPDSDSMMVKLSEANRMLNEAIVNIRTSECKISPFSSRMCEYGTKCCVIKHQ